MQETGAMSAPANHYRPGRRSVRSKEGCLTCKRRRVKCDEQRPRCSHCERLNMECKWRPQSTASSQANHLGLAGGPGRDQMLGSPTTDTASPNSSLFQPLQAVDEIFDYASFMWDAGDVWQPRAQFGSPNADAQARPATLLNSPSHIVFPHRASIDEFAGASTVSDETTQPEQVLTLQAPTKDDQLMDYFARVVVPPILAEVETQKKWLAMRHLVVEMANASPMVKWATLAFSNLMLSRRDGALLGSQQGYYDKATTEVATYDDCAFSFQEHTPHREYLLVTLFFISYVDILKGTIDVADSHLKRAYGIFQQGEKTGFAPVEKQFLQWLRLLDARAVSAGGDGLLLSKDDELLLVETSPASFEGGQADASHDDFGDGDIEDVLFQVLYQPGIVFFQKVLSFMGRISKIDPWHRPRGTVENEIEVMNVGASITADLRTLYDQRPPLMDFAVAGKLIQPHVSPHLAFVITRAFRTYLANYYASKVHLHRVAYKTFALTPEASDALTQIRRLAGLLVEGLDGDDALPVNMLWPLLMLGSEEQAPEERAWIKTQILRMEKVAGNAIITAQVLEEVQARQDASKSRVDIRSVMHAIFNSCFAIV